MTWLPSQLNDATISATDEYVERRRVASPMTVGSGSAPALRRMMSGVAITAGGKSPGVLDILGENAASTVVAAIATTLVAAPSSTDEFAQVGSAVLGVSRVEKANGDRFALLSRAYAGKVLSTEEKARLQIATQKIAKLLPRVTSGHMEALAELVESENRIKTRMLKRAQLLEEDAE